jgi:thiol-disulfide isomerase/thioredoxin
MASRRQALVLVAVGAVAAAAGWYVGPRLQKNADVDGVAALLAAPMRDLEGRSRSVLEWKGRVLVCNFWATWCAPCREEIPALGRIRSRMSLKGVEIVGIAIDQASKVADFAKQLDIVYPILVADPGSIELMGRLGNSAGGLPFTVVLDRGGKLAYRKLGSIAEAEFEARIASIV